MEHLQWIRMELGASLPNGLFFAWSCGSWISGALKDWCDPQGSSRLHQGFTRCARAPFTDWLVLVTCPLPCSTEHLSRQTPRSARSNRNHGAHAPAGSAGDWGAAGFDPSTFGCPLMNWVGALQLVFGCWQDAVGIRRGDRLVIRFSLLSEGACRVSPEL